MLRGNLIKIFTTLNEHSRASCEMSMRTHKANHSLWCTTVDLPKQITDKEKNRDEK